MAGIIKLKSLSNGLLDEWSRYDWRDNFFAPQYYIIQSLLKCGRTASGGGSDKNRAFLRCLAESAEIQALNLHEGHGDQQAFVNTRDGIAADVDLNFAKDRALREAIERQAVARWWNGDLELKRLASRWKYDEDLGLWLANTRIDAVVMRETALYFAQLPGELWFALAYSANKSGQDGMIGYGLDETPRKSLRKAVGELLLMEIIVAENYALAAHGETAAAASHAELIARITREVGLRLQSVTLDQTLDLETGQTHENSLWNRSEMEDWIGAPFEMYDITPPEGPLKVALCQPQLPEPTWPKQSGSPFI